MRNGKGEADGILRVSFWAGIVRAPARPRRYLGRPELVSDQEATALHEREGERARLLHVRELQDLLHLVLADGVLYVAAVENAQP